ncbi:MAG TPA: gluconokinase [Kineosporiaceae bacterium]|nr:gluconokinase [Kineosporiaceae bacterium]
MIGADDAPVQRSVVVVMGVSGTGKSTVAAVLAARLGWPFAEGDDFHPAVNVAAMRAGRPLTDADRWPWLASVATWIGERERAGTGGIVTCSALRRSYRDRLRTGHSRVRFLCLTAEPELIASRMAQRSGHYMPTSLLASQLSTLEPLEPDEPGTLVDSAQSLEAIVTAAIDFLSEPAAQPQ